ncbi:MULTISPECIES: 2-dehydropantoate 2-reductase [unclassified Corallococcus]|uniref:2-dehydropantoate 2-reductase n=1 Tax=unclassified Corallococcus TaxID=2685029 RepID=UPI001A8DEF1F|nr:MULTISPECIES: 2-dehydropantoate 2-reductase [unclassified Corallococcus]MBN9682850.1 2-dehydropantoate 2-reductase [Corallococcus sp. NCSPR001]WAS85612.1 2-dehydropantoate 2-reductase [Corallococcus sp. NCRR]
MASTPEVVVFGAGSIGCYVGGRLAATGATVRFIGRERIVAEVRAHGLHLTDWQGADLKVPSADVRIDTGPEALSTADLVLVTVKSAATEEAGQTLAPRLKPGAIVISFQNGLHNAAVLRGLLPGLTVLTGMVPFNVAAQGQGHFHAGSEGTLEVERHAVLAPFVEAFTRAGLALKQHADIVAVQWAKLLFNLNNALNALANLPLKEELSQRAWRRCLALAQGEALAVLERAGVKPAKLTPLPPGWIPVLLGSPDAVFGVLAKKMLAIDPKARSSMWDDLHAGRKTEVDYLNGEVVRLAHQHNLSAPVNSRLVELIREAESGQRRPWTGEALLADLKQAELENWG